MLKTDYKDYIPASGAGTLRKYQRIDNGDGTVSFQDVTEYAQTGDKNQASVINTTNAAVNEINTSKGEAGGYASLDEYGHIPKEQINMPEPTYSGKLVVSVTRYDGGEIGTTKVRVQNTALGMDLSYTPDALGKVTLHLVGNKTYSISLVNVPDPYYGEAATQYVGFDTENELNLQVKDQPDIIGFQVNLSTGAVDYTDGAANWTPMSMNGSTLEPGSFENSWLVKDVRPCLLKNGVVQYYLKKIDGFMMFDYTLKENGDPSDITTGNDGDVMIEIPKVYTKVTVETILNVTYLCVRFAKQSASGYQAPANIFGSPARDSIYYAAYKPWMASQSTSPISISGQTPVKYTTVGSSSSDPVAELKNKTHKYSGILGLASFDIMFLYMYYMMLFKTINLAAFGYSNVSYSNAYHATGNNNNKALCYISNGSFKFLGIDEPFSGITLFEYPSSDFAYASKGYAVSTNYSNPALINFSNFGFVIPYQITPSYCYDIINNFSSSGGLVVPSGGSILERDSAYTGNNLYLEFTPFVTPQDDSRCKSLLICDTHSVGIRGLRFIANANCEQLRIKSDGTVDTVYARYPWNISSYLTFKFLEPIS